MISIIDLLINNQGDLILDKYRPLSKFKISFRQSKYPIFKIDFFQNTDYIRTDNSSFKIQFKTTNLVAHEDIMNPTIHDIEELKQRIMILLRTEYKELNNNNLIGSKLYTYKHEDILSESVKNGIIDTITEELKTIVDNDTIIKVTVSPELIDGPFYCQNLNIYIFLNDNLVYNFNL